MPNFTESLTIRILGDSSHLQQELQEVTRHVTDLRTQFSRLGEVNRIIDQSLSRLSALSQPLQTVSRAIANATSQLRTLSRTPVTLNVSPALNSVAVLSAAIGRLAAQIRALPPVGLRLPAQPILPPGIRIPRFATGGLVNGPAGADHVPALLTAGEFVIREPVVRQLGATFLEALNQNRQPPARPSATPTSAAVEQSTVNNFGGISINVRTPTEVNNIIRDLRLQGIQLRNRRG